MTTQVLENLNVKLEPEDKKLFAQYSHDLGTTPSNAVRMFVKAFNEYQGFPFDVSRPYHLSADAQRSYDALNREIDNGTVEKYDSFDDILAEIDHEIASEG